MLYMTALAFISWDPPREAFYLPILNWPIYWYGLFFACGFLVSYFYVTNEFTHYLYRKHPAKKEDDLKTHLLSLKHEAFYVGDKLALWLFIGMILGARLGHVFLYDWPYYSDHLGEIPLIYKGGLSSHGATFGILISFIFFWKKNGSLIRIPWRKILDFLAPAACFAGFFIRLGNFFNQEILGRPSSLPWAVLFGNPVEKISGPCHPVQLYEALFYLFCAILLILYSKLSKTLRDGYIFGLFLTLMFTFRFIIEWVKLPQESFDVPYLQMGQILSIPFIGIGLYFMYAKKSD